MRISELTALCRLIVTYGFSSIHIQAALNQSATGKASDQYALLQRQAEISMAKTV